MDDTIRLQNSDNRLMSNSSNHQIKISIDEENANDQTTPIDSPDNLRGDEIVMFRNNKKQQKLLPSSNEQQYENQNVFTLGQQDESKVKKFFNKIMLKVGESTFT